MSFTKARLHFNKFRLDLVHGLDEVVDEVPTISSNLAISSHKGEKQSSQSGKQAFNSRLCLA